MNILHPELEAKGIVGRPTFFWGECTQISDTWDPLATVFVGYVVYAVNIYFSFTMSPLVLAIFISMLLHIKNISGSGLSSYIIDVYGFIMFLGIVGRGVIRFRRKPMKKPSSKTLLLKQRKQMCITY